MKNKLKSILSIEIPFLYLKKTLALVLIAGMVLTNGDFALLGHTVVEAAASSFKANGTSVDLDTPESWQAMANAKNNITDKSGVSQSVLGKAWLYGVVANEWNFDGESETNFAVKTLSGKAGQTGVTDKAKGDLSAESMVGESTTNGVVQIKGVPETLTLPKGQESKFFDSCNGLIYKYDTKENIEAAIDAMRSHVAQQSADMAQKNSIPDYSKVARGDSAQKITLDFTNSPEGTIYVNVDQWVVNSQWEVNDWSLSQAFKENGAITIKKKSNQIIVFNFSGSEVNLNKMMIEEDGKSQDTVGIANTPSSSNDIIEGLYFNMPNATKVHLQDSAGIFIAPKATVTTGGVGGGWLICDKLINGCEWHFTNGKLPDTYGKDSVQFHAVKNIAGKPADKDGFTFTLSEKDGNKWNTIQTKTNKGSAIDFDSIEYKYDTKNPNQEVKLYRISEEDKQTLNGVTYNAEKTDYYARVTLDKTSAAGQGNSNNYSVKASVAYYKDEACSQLIDTETPVFNNTEANGSLLVLKSVSGPKGFELTDDQKQAIVFTVSDSNGATIASFTYKNMLDHSGVTLPDGSVVRVTYEEGGVKLSNLTPGSYTVSEKVDQDNDVAGYAHTTTVTVDGKEETTNSGSVTVESAKDASIAFKNSYAQASVELNGTKTIDGNKPKDKEFAFSLYKASKNGKDFKRGDRIETVRNNGEGNFSFSTITYSKAGTYYYFILEEDPSHDAKGQETGIKKNTQKYLVTVVVQKNRDGSLTAEAPSYQEMASITTNGESTKPSNTAAFMNTTEKSLGSLSLSAKKELIGRDLKAGEFTFELVAADQDGKPITENGKEVILQSVKNGVKKADGSNNIQFKEITYQKDLYNGIDQRGTYYYIVREKQGTDSHIAYTKVTYLVRVNVTDSKTDGKLEVEKSIQLLSDGTSNETAKATDTNKENIEFVNTYSASGSITISGKKTVNGKSIDDQAQSISGAKNQEFIFRLDQMAKDGAKASEKSDGLHRTAKTNASGRFTFDKIPYTLDDAGNTYYYKLSEDTSKLQAGYSKDFDDQYISVKVEKSNKDDGTLELTISSKTYDKDGKVKKSDGATINVNGADYTYDAGNLNNKYAASTSVKLHGNKTINGQKPSKDVTDKFSFKLSLLEWRDASGSVHTQKDDTYRQTVKTDNYSQIVKTDKDGNFSFKPLAFYLDDEHNQIGTYKYQIEEVDVPEGYSVNTSAQIVIVKIEDNGKGQLVATMTDEKGKAIKADPEKNSYTVKGYTFDNTYEAAGHYAFYGQKVLTGRSLKENEFSFKVVELINKDGKTTEQKVATAKNTADGSLVFDYGTNPDGSIKTGIDYSLDHVGTHTYKITEDKTTLGGIKENKEAYILTVDVKDNGKGALDVKTTSMKKQEDGKDVDGSLIKNPSQEQLVKEIVFHNVYKARGSISITGTKQMLGRKLNDWDKENVYFNMFIYGIYHRDTGKWEYPKDQSPIYQGGLKDISQDGQTATIAFGHYEMRDGKQVLVEEPITYTEKDANNVYIYRFSENIRGLENDQTKHGVTMDGSMGQAIVSIKDNGDGTLSVQEDSDFQGNHDTTKDPIVNTYHASGELNLSGTKELIGKDLKQGDFKFILRQTDKDGKELTDGYSEIVSNAAPSTVMGANANGSTAGFAFRAIKYTEADAGKDFYYTVSELAGDQAGITYDRKVYQIHVKVTDNGDGTLKVERKDEVKQISFTNFYNASASLKLNLIKTINGKTVDESHVAKLEDKEFTFTLTEMNGKGEKASPKKNGKTETITVSGKDGKASFSPLSYTLADKDQTYYYRIAEDASTSKMPKGFKKDGKDFYFSITVSDDGSGLLHLTSDSDAINDGMDGNTFTAKYALGHTFNNTYSASGELPVKGNKTINGLSPDKNVKDLFAFTLTEISVNGVPVEKPYTETVKTDKDGKFSFTSLKYSMNPDIANSPSGSVKYIYQIEETSCPTGYTKDTEPKNLEVIVSDYGDGTLSIQSTEPETGYTFNNLYNAKGSITLKGKKTLHGRDMEADEFHFTVTETDDKGTALKVKNAEGKEVDKVVARGSNAAASKDQAAAITFDPITYDSVEAVGTHTYEITEDPFQGAAEDGSKDGLQANTQRYILQVEVSDNGDGTLKAEAISGTDADGETIDPATGIAFTNTYKASGAITLNGSKKLTGRDMEADEFHFTVTETDDKGNPLKVKDADGNTVDKVVARGSNAAASKDQAAAITFDPITYDSVDAVGTHTYEITEDPFQGAAEDGSKDGLQANTQRYIVQVEVSDNRDGTLTAEAVSATDQNGQTITPASGIVFTNNYKAYGSLDLLGIKILEGRQLTTQDNFRFVVEEETRDAEGNVNRRQVSSAKLTQESIAADKQSAELVFDRINYTLADVGTHTYKIHEVIPEAAEKIAGITYDTREYTLVVTVSDKGDGTLTVETRDAAGNKVDVTKADTYSFKNSYAANGDITLTGSKTLVGRDMKDGEFTFTVREQNADGSYKKAADGTDLIVATGKNEEAKNGQAAAIDFTKISYKDITEIGTHTYVVTEDPFQDAAEDGSKDGLQANSQSFKVVVRVTDDGQGNLTASAISGTDADGETINPVTDIAFINTYEASGDHSFYGTKTVAGRDLTPGEDYQFQVEEVITDEDGKENRVEVSTGHLNPDTIVGNHGDILFGTLHYTLADVGTHTYKIHEVIPADQDKMAGITYDKTEYTEIVTVSDKGDGSLEVVAKDADGNLINSGETKTYNFTNTYQNVAVRFTGSKTLAGGDIASYPGAFRFDLVDSDGQVIDTAKNDATGRFTFAPIYYEASDVGEHTYTIVEENAGRIINGIKYDDSEIPVTVTVENRAGKLVATGQVEGDEIAFHNEKLSEITVQKNWADDQNAANARPQQITVDLLQNEQVVRSAVLTGATDTWTYTFKDLTPGTYKVRERSDSPYYEVSYDKQILDLTDENGQAKDETVTITNTFERTVDLVAYKDLMGQALNDGQFRFVLHRNSDGDDTSHDLTTTNRGDGSISFYDVTYDPNGYTMYEVAEQSKYPHITFDEHNSIATGLRFDPEGNPITQEDGTALYTFKNVYRPIVLRVQKRSKSAPFDPLVGATYGLYRYSADGNDVLVEAQLSDSNGYMYYGKIEPGVIYYFKEISAPAGHEVDPYAGKHFQVKYTENGNIAVYDEDGNPDTTYGDITTMEDKTEGYRTTEIIKEKDSLDEIQANEKQSRYAYTGNGVDAVAIADKGAFPEGTTMVVTPLTGDRLAEVETLLENNVGQFNTMAFYDITFTDADGKEVEPAFGDVDVTIQPEVGLDTKGIELKNLKLIHLIDDGDPESTVKTVSLVTGSIAAEEKDGEEKLTQTKITSKSFSVFGLIDPKDSTLGNNYLLTANGVGDFVSKLKVAKLDTQGNFIPNATLDVYTFDPKKKDGIGERVIRWTTAEGCQYLQRILNVKTPYVLVETNAPDGYAIADNIIFSIGKYDSSITCYTLKDGKRTASEKETQLHTNGSELIMVDDPITVMNKTDYKIIPQVKELTRDREITVPGAPKTGDKPIIPLVVILLAGIIGFAGIEIEKRRKNRKEK